jgi:hypothetical protein
MKSARAAIMVGVGLLLAQPAWAHHAFSAEYNVDQPVTLKGTLTKMEWVNPHGWLYVDVKDADGKIASWAIETGNPNALLKRGLRTTNFPVGVELIVTGFKAKNGQLRANGRTVKFSDGRDFFLGSSGTGAPAADGDPR